MAPRRLSRVCPPCEAIVLVADPTGGPMRRKAEGLAEETGMPQGIMKEVAVEEAWKRKYPEQVSWAVSVDSEGKADIISLGWCMPTSFDPPMIAISVGKTRYSHQLISESREFVVAFPSEEMGKEVLYCGTHSGRDVDKFKETGLVAVPAKKVRPPLIEGCVANFECKVVGEIETGDHTIFAGEVVAAHVSEEKKRRLYNLGNYKLAGV